MAEQHPYTHIYTDAAEDALGPTHAEQPDSLSPCGISTWDVPATSDLSEVECLVGRRRRRPAQGTEPLPDRVGVGPPPGPQLEGRSSAARHRMR